MSIYIYTRRSKTVAHDCKRYLCFSIYYAMVQNYIFPQFPNITLGLSLLQRAAATRTRSYRINFELYAT